MSAKPQSARPSDLSSSTLLRHAHRVWLSIALGAGLVLPSIAAADDVAADTPAATQVALHQPLHAGSGIRLKLHGIEDLNAPDEPAKDSASEEQAASDTPKGTPDAALSAADELKKQAQTRYLASKLKKQEATVRKYVDLAWAEAYRRDWLQPELLIAIIQKESAFRPKVQSRYGAQGLMQVVRRWHKDKLHPSESLFDPAVNIRVGADVLEEYLELANGNLDDALRKYSGNARNYANVIKKETQALARVAERAALRGAPSRG